uniref:non-specific serine/threonine protein kinase n=1 Tax=Globodera pallida TaxID=36090 RepID=A0A183C4K6_GLOPA
MAFSQHSWDMSEASSSDIISFSQMNWDRTQKPEELVNYLLCRKEIDWAEQDSISHCFDVISAITKIQSVDVEGVFLALVDRWIPDGQDHTEQPFSQMASDPDSTIDFVGSHALSSSTGGEEFDFFVPVVYDDPQTTRIIVLLRRIKDPLSKIVELSRKSEIDVSILPGGYATKIRIATCVLRFLTDEQMRDMFCISIYQFCSNLVHVLNQRLYSLCRIDIPMKDLQESEKRVEFVRSILSPQSIYRQTPEIARLLLCLIVDSDIDDLATLGKAAQRLVQLRLSRPLLELLKYLRTIKNKEIRTIPNISTFFAKTFEALFDKLDTPNARKELVSLVFFLISCPVEGEGHFARSSSLLASIGANFAASLVAICANSTAEVNLMNEKSKTSDLLAVAAGFESLKKDDSSFVKNSESEAREFIAEKNFHRKFSGSPIRENAGFFVHSSDDGKERCAGTELPGHLDGYEIGDFIAKGCNGAVYELKVRMDEDPIRVKATKKFPLALKIMFNYNWEAVSERVLWRQMGTELIPLAPLPKTVLQGAGMAKIKMLPRPHPNIIKMYTAFIDQMPALPGAEKLYPEALPNIAENPMSYELKTLHLVMKRYRMTLHDYLEQKSDYEKRDPMVGRLLFGQLLEAVDMKSDNVLLDFDNDAEVPHLVLSDFGTALATGKWTVICDDDMADLGGNVALRAPEIRRVSPAPDTHLNFEMADTWAAGTLAYEIFTGQNPFYQLLSSETYSQRDLPILPLRIIEPIHRIVDEMLSVDPQQRPNPAVAANVVAVSLLRFGHDVRTFLRECGTELISLTCENIRPVLKRASLSKDRMNNKLRHLAELYATETITLQLANSPKISAAELQLRATFLSRLDSGELHSALKYFIGPDSSLSFGTDDGAQYLTINHQMAN